MTALVTAAASGFVLGVVTALGGLVIAACAIWKGIR